MGPTRRTLLRPDTIDLIGPQYDNLDRSEASRTLLICSAPRTASYELCRLLLAAGIGVPHEYFHEGYARTAAARWGIEGDPLHQDNIGGYIQALRKNRTQGGVFAVKVQYWEFDRWLRNVHGEALFRNASIVHLFRPDVARQFKSMRAAMMTGRWDFSSRASRPPQPDTLAEALNSLELILQEDAGWRRLFALLDVAPLFITTDDVVDRPRETVSRIAQLTGVSVNQTRLDQSLAASKPYGRDRKTEQKVGRMVETLRGTAFTSSQPLASPQQEQPEAWQTEPAVAAQILEGSDLFDGEWYCRTYPDVAAAKFDPALHYLIYGAKEGRNPSALFDTNFYLARYPDVARSGLNPLLHFIRWGLAEGRSPRPATPIDPAPRLAEKFYFELSPSPLVHRSVRPIAFYLPQFHAIPENDAWWGEGFTEWTNTRKARPLFDGHRQPRTPTAHLGYYDLSDTETLQKQVAMAKAAGLYGFCFHFYWFAGKTLLEKPLLKILKDATIDLPFCLSWANENWTRQWDGQDDEVLIAQEHSEADTLAFFDHVQKYFEDDRYIRIDGRPVLIIYRPKSIALIETLQRVLRDRAREKGWPDLYLIFGQTFGETDPRDVGFDAAVEFPPQFTQGTVSPVETIPGSAGNIFDYEALALSFCEQPSPPYKKFRGVTLGWDNTARRSDRGNVFHGFSLSAYARWLSHACKAVADDPHLTPNEKFVFINAWNEWGEGTYLEPDTRYGLGYLEATKRALAHRNAGTSRPRISVLVPNHSARRPSSAGSNP